MSKAYVTDVLFATPVGKSQLKELAYLKNLYGNLGASIHILIDDVLQLQLLHNHSSGWSVFIKVTNDEYYEKVSSLILSIISYNKYSQAFKLHGFHTDVTDPFHTLASATQVARNIFQEKYARASQRNSNEEPRTDQSLTLHEWRARYNPPPDPQKMSFCLSISTDFFLSHSAEHQITDIHANDRLEYNLTNCVILDLCQVTNSNNSFTIDDIAGGVLSEICLRYNNSYVINCGILALSTDRCQIKDHPEWHVKSKQDHSIINHKHNGIGSWDVGDRLLPQNTVINSILSLFILCHRR